MALKISELSFWEGQGKGDYLVEFISQKSTQETKT